MTPGAPLPSYAGRLLAFHRAHEAELRRLVRSLPLVAGSHVLDVACGDGTYGILMAELGARVSGLDLDPQYLELAAERADGAGVALELSQGDASRLPFSDRAFDGAFCAQSFYSLQDIPKVLGEMRRVVRPGGWVAVMENDSLHRVVLPWPPELELKLRLAEHQALAREQGESYRFYIGRFLGTELENAGLSLLEVTPFASQRRAPLSPDERTFLSGYLEELLDRAREHLAPADWTEALRLASPDSPECVLNAPDFAVTYLDIVACARVPPDPSS